MAVLKTKVNNAAHRDYKSTNITTTTTSTSTTTTELLEAVMMVVEMTILNYNRNSHIYMAVLQTKE